MESVLYESGEFYFLDAIFLLFLSLWFIFTFSSFLLVRFHAYAFDLFVMVFAFIVCSLSKIWQKVVFNLVNILYTCCCHNTKLTFFQFDIVDGDAHGKRHDNNCTLKRSFHFFNKTRKSDFLFSAKCVSQDKLRMRKEKKTKTKYLLNHFDCQLCRWNVIC